MASGTKVIAIAAAAALLFGCADSDDDDAGGTGDASSASSAPGTVPVTLGTLTPADPPDCPAEVVATPDDWAYVLPEMLQPTQFESDETHFDVTGITNDPDGLLTAVSASSFPGFDLTEPTGDATSLAVGFSGAIGGGQVSLADTDGDGCWDVEIDATLVDTPATAPGSTDATAPPQSTTPAEGEFRQNYEAAIGVGTGQITTGRGAFQLKLTRCDAGALLVEGLAAEGALSVTSVDGATFAVAWTYADGTTVSDQAASVLGVSATALSLVADGQNAEGLESLFIELSCPFG